LLVRDGYHGVDGEDGYREGLAEEEAHQHESDITQMSSVRLFWR